MHTSDDLNKEKSTITRLIITSDPQYPWTPAMDNGNSNESENEQKRNSENLIREQYRSISSYALANGGALTLINGDITAFGHTWQRNKMNQIFNEEFLTHYFYGLGNHDIENNLNDCWENQCAGGSLSTYINHVQKMSDKFLDEMDITISGSSTQRYYNGCFAYSIIIGDIYSIQLNNYPTMELNFRASKNHFFKMKSTLDWLEKVLNKAHSLGKIIIVNVHKPNDWKQTGASQRFKDLLKEYGVSAVFAGHYHKKLGLRGEYSEYFGNIPVFLSGSASQKSYLIVEQIEENLNVYSVQKNKWEEKKLEKSIKLNLPIKGRYKIKTALNETSGVDVSINKLNPLGDRNVHLYNENSTKRHQWNFHYDSIRNAYQIRSAEEPTKVLAWNDFENSRNVFLTKDDKKSEHYWILEDVGNDYYIIKNYKNPNLVLEVEGGKTDNNTNIHVHERSGKNDQRFKLVRVDSTSLFYQQDLPEQELENTLLLNS